MAVDKYYDGSKYQFDKVMENLEKQMRDNTVKQMVMTSEQSDQSIVQMRIKMKSDLTNSAKENTANVRL